MVRNLLNETCRKTTVDIGNRVRKVEGNNGKGEKIQREGESRVGKGKLSRERGNEENSVDTMGMEQND